MSDTNLNTSLSSIDYFSIDYFSNTTSGINGCKFQSNIERQNKINVWSEYGLLSTQKNYIGIVNLLLCYQSKLMTKMGNIHSTPQTSTSGLITMDNMNKEVSKSMNKIFECLRIAFLSSKIDNETSQKIITICLNAPYKYTHYQI
eukprot:34203_1